MKPANQNAANKALAKATEYCRCRAAMADRLHEITGWSAKTLRLEGLQKVLTRSAHALVRGECVVVQEVDGWYRVSRRKPKASGVVEGEQ